MTRDAGSEVEPRPGRAATASGGSGSGSGDYDTMLFRIDIEVSVFQRRGMSASAAERRQWIILSVLIVSLVAIVLDNTVLNVALKTISEPRGGLGASQSQLEWAINSYTLVFAGLLFTFGVIGDRIGRKRMLTIGLTMFGLASLLSSYAQSPAELIWARAAMGLGGAAVMPQTLSIITNTFDPAERPRAIGIWAAAVGVAIAIGPVTGGLLLDHFWWGSVFLINAPLTAVGVIAAVMLIPESKGPAPGGLDYLGVLLSIAGLVLLVYGIIKGGDVGSWLHSEVLGPIAAGLAILTVFCWHERRTEHPSLDVRLFSDPRLSAAATAIALNFFAMAGVYFFMGFYLQNVRGFSPLHAGLLTTPVAIGQLVASTQSAGLVRRFGAKVVSATGLLIVTGALIGYHSLTLTTPPGTLEVIFLLQGAGMGIVMPTATESVMSVVPRDHGGAGSAITNTSRQVAVALGVAVLGSILAQAYRSGLAPDLLVLPRAARAAATSSVAATQTAAGLLGPRGARLLAAANHSFVHAMHITTTISAAIAAAGALLMMTWMPGLRAGPTDGNLPDDCPAGQLPGQPIPVLLAEE
jgi:EmrB/QacA subfamily drug resistance transporter